MVESQEDKGVRLKWDGGQTIVSECDVKLVLKLNLWMDGEYVGCKVGKYKHLHNLLLGHSDAAWPIDHINACRWDNRRSNLRIISRAENVIRPLRVDDEEEARILRAYANGELDTSIHEYLKRRRESR